MRLDGWYYIRRVNSDEMLKAISEAGFGSESLRKQVLDSMQNQKVYHVVIRGNDPKFMPLGRCDGQDVPTDYICEQLKRRCGHAMSRPCRGHEEKHSLQR